MPEVYDRRVPPPGFWELFRQWWMGDLPPAHQRIVTSFIGRLIARGSFGFFMVWALGWGEPIGLSSGFARADDTDKKIAAAVDPILQDIRALKTGQQRTADQVDFLIRLNLEAKLRDLKRQYCVSSPNTPQRRLIDANMREAQAQYRQVNGGTEYSVPSCEDL